jgi:hypothetical protein
VGVNMRKRTVIIISIALAFILMSGGYGIWTENLNVKGDITVVPDPKVQEEMKSDLEDLQLELTLAKEDLEMAIEQQRLEAERLEKERVEAERLEKERLLAEQQQTLLIEESLAIQAPNQLSESIADSQVVEEISIDNKIVDETIQEEVMINEEYRADENKEINNEEQDEPSDSKDIVDVPIEEEVITTEESKDDSIKEAAENEEQVEVDSSDFYIDNTDTDNMNNIE